MLKILFFAPHSAIWVHAFPEALVAEALSQSGHRVVYVTCGRALRRGCVAMSAFALDSRSSEDSRAQICARCDAHKEILRRNFRLDGYDLSDRLDAEVHEDVAR